MEAHEPKRLYRSRDDRMIGGVCGGLGRHFGIDPVIVRIAAVVLLLFGGATRSPTSPSSCSCRRSRGPASPRPQRTAAARRRSSRSSSSCWSAGRCSSSPA